MVHFTACPDALARFLVFPVGCHAEFRYLMHGKGADLDFQRIAPGHNRGVQGLVAIGLGHGDIVLETARNGLPHGMNDPQDTIAVLDAFHQHAHSRQIVDLADVLLIPLHLLVDAVEMLGTAADIRHDLALGQLLLDLLDGVVNESLALLALLLDTFHQVIICLRIKIAQAQILQLPFHIGNAQAIGQGRIYFNCLLGDALLLVLPHVLEGAHIVQAVCQLDHDDPDVLGHGQEHLAVVLQLHLFL